MKNGQKGSKMDRRKYYVVRVIQFWKGRDIADGFNIDKTKDSREEAMELAKYYGERLPYAQITVTEVEAKCIYSTN